MIPIRLSFVPGIPLFEQVVYAARKAIVSGKLRPGDAFPSTRVLSRELKINPNTAHKVITHLINEGLLEVRPGIGAFVAEPRASTRAQRRQLLETELEHLVVEARKLGLGLADVQDGIAEHWRKLEPPSGEDA
ncbi:GntR family transcriptional regulator [uncultured Paludibaculum sp.]|uniref:GntR family transcriptional regulator n=1 Tax=uncultured Paludibaculum sp. TaxID=1765020 RepID=UPI002AAC079E|nr:GntR family transcriptional regulator [uncultured Paludibaculum sp.]